MSAKLRNMLVLLGFISAAVGVITVYTPKDDTTKGELLDAGVSSYVGVDVTCLASRLTDAGTREYKTKTVGAKYDSVTLSLILPPLQGGAVEWYRPDLCRKESTANLAEGASADVPDECACSSGVGACNWRGPDGGGAVQAAPTRQTLPVGNWSGAGCVRKPCGSVLSRDGGKPWDDSWPSGCPR